MPAGKRYHAMTAILRRHALHSVCEEASCPNIGECFNAGTTAFMILGSVCTRNCGFCGVTTGRPKSPDTREPGRLAEVVEALGLSYVVITSVTRDDLPDGGAGIFGASIRAIKKLNPDCRIEVLIPDFRGDRNALAAVVEAGPFVLNHNLETVPRLYRRVRPQARYERSLALLATAKEIEPSLLTKSGLMVGLGESEEEVFQVMADLRSAGCDFLTIGQYLSPSLRHLPVRRFYSPGEFEAFVRRGRGLGFRGVEAGSLVRSSYHAAQQVALPPT